MKTIMEKYLHITKKKLVALLYCFGLVMVMASAILLLQKNNVSLANAEITNWGLSFQNEGKTPNGNASSEFLASNNAFFVGDENEKTIYLTFDCGYENGYTSNILDTLKKHNVSATFFVVGNYLESDPELVNRMVNEGHVVGNHTWTHPDMSKIKTIDNFQNELIKVENKYKEITGKEMYKIYRPPQGKFCEQNLLLAKQLGYNTAFWSLAYVDWYTENQPTHQEAFDKLLPRIHNGAVVLLHSTSKTNCEILDELLTKWTEMGYSFGDIKSLCK